MVPRLNPAAGAATKPGRGTVTPERWARPPSPAKELWVAGPAEVTGAAKRIRVGSQRHRGSTP